MIQFWRNEKERVVRGFALHAEIASSHRDFDSAALWRLAGNGLEPVHASPMLDAAEDRDSFSLDTRVVSPWCSLRLKDIHGGRSTRKIKSRAVNQRGGSADQPQGLVRQLAPISLDLLREQSVLVPVIVDTPQMIGDRNTRRHNERCYRKNDGENDDCRDGVSCQDDSPRREQYNGQKTHGWHCPDRGEFGMKKEGNRNRQGDREPERQRGETIVGPFRPEEILDGVRSRPCRQRDKQQGNHNIGGETQCIKEVFFCGVPQWMSAMISQGMGKGRKIVIQ